MQTLTKTALSLALVAVFAAFCARSFSSAPPSSPARPTDVEMHEANDCPLDCSFDVSREFPCVCPSEARP